MAGRRFLFLEPSSAAVSAGVLLVTGATAGFVAGFQVAEKLYATEAEIARMWRRTKIISGTTAAAVLLAFVVGRLKA